MPFLKNDERIPMWQAQYDKIIAVLQNENAIRVADRQAIARDT
jgi:Mg2+/Co2+ transporter CorB